MGKKQRQFFYCLGLVIQLGMSFAFSTLIGLFAGIFFDKKLQTTPIFTIIFLMFGVLGGFMSAWKLIKEGLPLENKSRERQSD